MGKNKYIETPEKLWDLFKDYKKYSKENPIYIIEQKKGGTNMKLSFEVNNKKDIENIRETFDTFNDSTVGIPSERPLTMVGFECYVMEHTKISYPDLTEYFEGKNNSYKDYFPIATRIRKEIEADLITGGLTKMYDSNMTSRITGLTEKTDITTNGKDLSPPSAIEVEIVLPKDD